MPTFDSTSGKAAGIKSGIARTDSKPENIVDKVLEDTRYTHALVTSWLKANPCKACERGGPKTLIELVKLAELQAKLGEQLLDRFRGKPATESPLGRDASVKEYTAAYKALNTPLSEEDSQEDDGDT